MGRETTETVRRHAGKRDSNALSNGTPEKRPTTEENGRVRGKEKREEIKASAHERASSSSLSSSVTVSSNRIYVPTHNSRRKNAPMQEQGPTLTHPATH